METMLLSLIFLSFCTLQQVCSHLHTDVFIVTCSYSFPPKDEKCSPPQGAAKNNHIDVPIPRGETVLYALEVAATTSQYFNNFSVSYGFLGYCVTQFNGVKSSNDCEWAVYITKNESFVLTVDLDNYLVPFSKNSEDSDSGVSINLVYQSRSKRRHQASSSAQSSGTDSRFKSYGFKAVAADTFNVIYTLESTDSRCPSVTSTNFPVSIERGGSILSVMEAAVKRNPFYQFSADYNGRKIGYSVTSIAGISQQKHSCRWVLYYVEAGQSRYVPAPVGPSNFVIPSNNGKVVYKLTYEDTNLP